MWLCVCLFVRARVCVYVCVCVCVVGGGGWLVLVKRCIALKMRCRWQLNFENPSPFNLEQLTQDMHPKILHSFQELVS